MKGEAAPPSAWTSDRTTGLSVAVLMAVAFLVVGRQAYQVASGPLPPRSGDAAPAFSAPTLLGADMSLADHAGKVVLVDFWATWCPPCVASMPGLERLYASHGERGFVVLGVNQEPHDLGRVRRYVQDARLSFPILVDDGTIAPRYGVFSYPTSLLVDRRGVVRRVYRGPASEEALARDVEALLEAGS